MKNCAPHEIILCFDKEELPGEDKYLSCQTVREEKHEHLNERKRFNRHLC